MLFKRFLLGILFYIFITCNYTISQTKLVEEIIIGKNYQLRFSSKIDYSIGKRNSKNIFLVKNYFDESKSGDVKLPSHDIFISLPAFSNPKLQYKLTSQKYIDAIPEFNPSVRLSKTKEVIYEEPKQIKDTQTDFIVEKGYLWIGNNYCLHLNVHPAIFNSSKNVIELTQSFEIELIFDDEIQKLSKQVEEEQIFSLICNSSFNLSNANIGNKYNFQGADSWIDYTQTYLKLGVSHDGIYRLRRSDFESKGISVQSINPKTFKLFLRGEEIPIWVEGEDELSFDQGDYIEFAGLRNMGGHHREISSFNEPYNEYLGRYTDTTVYWLTWGGIDGKRVQLSDGSSTVATDTLDYYSQIDHYETNTWFDFSCASLVRRELPYWIENKTWLHDKIGIGTHSRNFSVNSVYPEDNAKLIIKLQDIVSDVSTNAHLLALSVNSELERYDSTYINKYDKSVLIANVPSNQLNEATNTLKIHSFQTEASINGCFFDWYEIEYPRYLKPFNDSLNFAFPFVDNEVEQVIKLQDIITDNYSLWKYGSTFKKYNVSKTNAEIIFADSINSSDKFTFIDELKIRTPKIYYVKQFQNLRGPQFKADYIAITHPKFHLKTEEYAQFISDSYNINTQIVLIDDIYDEFSYGFFNPESIQDFLKSTHTYWQNPKPQNVVLIGGATYDYYGNRYTASDAIKERVVNYVPSYGASVSDNWFVSWDTTGAYIPQMNIGRIPVTTSEEFEWYFEKHRNYLTQEYDEWNKHYLFFSGGNPTNQSELDILRETNQFVIDTYTEPSPIGGKVDHFYKTNDPTTNFGPYSQEYIQNSIDNGGVFISYIGHSGTQTWDNSITHPSQLKNDQDRYPIVTDFGCSTGRFAEPDVVSFSQLFILDSEGQALGYVGNSSLGFISTSISMPKLFYKKILAEDIYNVSEAHKQAKIDMLQTYGATGVYELFALTNTLVGDPLISLPIPQKPNFVIKEENIDISSDLITDLQDSVVINFFLFNHGKVITDSLEISVLHYFENETDSTYLKIKVPNYKDSLSVKLVVKDKVGLHNASILLDPANKIDEISTVDNAAAISFNVASSAIRPIIQYQMKNGITSNINFLNPTSTPNNENIMVEFSIDKSFSEVNSIEIKFDTLFTGINLPMLVNNQRYWCRAKITESENYGTLFSFIKNVDNKFLIIDSISFADSYFESVLINHESINLDSTKVLFEVLSAGFSDGKTALIMMNKQNMIPENTNSRGHHICLFDDTTFDFVDHKVFDLLGGGSSVANEYISFLDTISSNSLVMFAILDEGEVNLSTALRDKIKLFGSALIDDVAFRSSWAFIGKKGALIGSMPEAVSAEAEGSVTIDTTISFLSESGTMLTTEIGPTSKWDKMVVSQETPSNSSITYTPIGVKADGILDTLSSVALQDSVADLSFINSDLYPKIKLLAEFQASDDKQSPILNSLGVDYTDVAELGLNYQVVSVEHDSITQGEKNMLKFYIYNVGESLADSFAVKVELLKPDNSSQLIDNFITSIDSSDRKYFEYDYTLLKEFGWGNMLFAITADSDNKITEFFEDNNYYQIPFYVKKDTLTDVVSAEATVTIDGYDIIDGDFVSNEPEIIFQIDYQGGFPVHDTTSVNYYLDNKRIPYTSMQMEYDTINQTITSTYNPPLEDGDHFLRVNGDSFSLEKYFEVSNELKIVDLYNYPNPFAENTAFTFKLTRVPEEVIIRIFSVAGRLIKNIYLTSSDLKTDFNKIDWNGRDEDGDRIANGVYIYKVILKDPNESESYTQKLAVMR